MTSEDRRRDAYYRRTYGVTLAQYDTLLKRQHGVCAICHNPPKNARLAVDHNHKTGEIRGLLCWSCNHRLIGRHTDYTLFESAARYLKKGTGWYVPKRPKRSKRRKPRS